MVNCLEFVVCCLVARWLILHLCRRIWLCSVVYGCDLVGISYVGLFVAADWNCLVYVWLV